MYDELKEWNDYINYLKTTVKNYLLDKRLDEIVKEKLNYQLSILSKIDFKNMPVQKQIFSEEDPYGEELNPEFEIVWIDYKHKVEKVSKNLDDILRTVLG